MKTITKYRAYDGREFMVKKHCELYEKHELEVERIMLQLPERPDSHVFLSGDGYIQHDGDILLKVRQELLAIAEVYASPPFNPKGGYPYKNILHAQTSKLFLWPDRTINELPCPENLKKASIRMTSINKKMREYASNFDAFKGYRLQNIQLNK